MKDLWAVILGFLIVLSLLTIVMNISVAIVVITTRKLRTATNIYLASLSAADTLVGSIVMAAMTVYSIYGYWPLGTIACTIWIMFDYCSCTISMLHLDVIAFQRYEAINRPLEYHTKEKKDYKHSVKHITAIWIIGVLAWLPAALYFRIKDAIDSNIDEMDCLYVPPKEYLITQACIVYYLPIIIMVYFYCRTVRMLTGSGLSKTFSEHLASLHEGNTDINAGSRSYMNHLEVPGSKEYSIKRNQVLLQKRILQEKRIAKILGIVIACFLICWVPFCILWPIVAYCPSCIPIKVYEASIWMAMINSTINPILLFTMNKDYRKALRKRVLRVNETSVDPVIS